MRKILCVILMILVVTISLTSTIVWAENTTNNISSNTVNNVSNSNTVSSDLQNKQKEVQEQIDNTNEEISNLQVDMTENLEQIQKLDEQIANAEQELSETTEKVDILKQSIASLEETLEKEQKKYDTQKEIFEDRVVALYEAGNTQYLDVILNSRSISEFISSYYVISEIAECDADLLNTIAERKNNIQNASEKLKKEKQEMSTIIERQTRTANILKTTKSFRETYINKLSAKEQEAQAKLDEYNRVLKEVNQQILDLAKQGVDVPYTGGELAWPVPGYTRISSPYGMRTHPITGVYKLHTGVDISAPTGANFVAANDGIVVKAEYNVAYGRMVVIDHGGGISTLYAHGSEFLVQVGQEVKRNQPVLKVGSTGYSTGPHAHFEVRKNGVVTNPMPYITNGVVPNSEEDKNQESNSSKTNGNNTSTDSNNTGTGSNKTGIDSNNTENNVSNNN